jgi:hypothetical protein
MKHTVVVMVQIETNDDRLDPERIAVDTVAGTAALRVAVLANLKRLTRVIAVLPVEHAKALMLLHEAAGEMLIGEKMAERPPSDYVPPTRD